MDLFKQHKEMEHKVHENLYNNLVLLSHFYPTSKDFDAVFRKDMFVKNNKAAFFQVIHYLLNSIHPEITKQRLTSWPIHDVKCEVRFRNEVIAYINEINSIYPYAHIPTCQASTLISPGGYRFAKFMLKVSQFAIYKHLENSDLTGLLYPIKPNNKVFPGMVKTQLKHLSTLVSNIESESKEIIKNFDEKFEGMKNKGEEITKSLTKLNKDIHLAQENFKTIQTDFDLKHPSYPSSESLEEKLLVIKAEVQKIVEMKNLFSHCEQLLKCLSGTDLLLEHNEDSLQVPKDIEHILQNTRQLDLIQFFRGLSVLLEKRSLELCEPTKSFIGTTLKTIEQLSKKYSDVLSQLEGSDEHMNHLFEELKLVLDVTASESDNMLAVPLL
ncbi:uncharacterized protein LOC115886013 [Sitophilus oryzae]|uniref:Uncharacterized protein LOC115886013 n=1 Tax=Sitophilus oryzae TaxID=7048 RepID=A0A6J2YC80_SITOR|nr:uncharacterized protein LOC115886013 [Sitophilus oryzae]